MALRLTRASDTLARAEVRILETVERWTFILRAMACWSRFRRSQSRSASNSSSERITPWSFSSWRQRGRKQRSPGSHLIHLVFLGLTQAPRTVFLFNLRVNSAAFRPHKFLITLPMLCTYVHNTPWAHFRQVPIMRLFDPFQDQVLVGVRREAVLKYIRVVHFFFLMADKGSTGFRSENNDNQTPKSWDSFKGGCVWDKKDRYWLWMMM